MKVLQICRLAGRHETARLLRPVSSPGYIGWRTRDYDRSTAFGGKLIILAVEKLVTWSVQRPPMRNSGWRDATTLGECEIDMQ